jgi:hypothetical protein
MRRNIGVTIRSETFPYVHPSPHPSIPVPDVLPDASYSCTLLMLYPYTSIHAPKGYKAGSYVQESLLELKWLL